MNAAEKYDVQVFGGGTAGKLMAWKMAKEGQRTAVIERKYIGGSCPNVAGLPSKNVIHSAKGASLVGRHREFGIETGSVAINMAGVYARKRDMVDGIVQVHLDKYHAAGDELILSDGTFVAPRTLQVALRDGGERTLTADRVFVNARTVEGTDILVAVGRTPNTRGIGLEKAGVEITEKGHIRVNDRLETTAPNVWAMGECAGSPYFTHVAEDDFDIVRENLNGGHRSAMGRLVPYCVFIDPELGARWPERETSAGTKCYLPACLRSG